jgi:hypothetical protein
LLPEQRAKFGARLFGGWQTDLPLQVQLPQTLVSQSLCLLSSQA